MSNYRKIDITLSPAIALAVLERRNVCSCGFDLIKPEVPIGTEYNVDLKSVRWAKFLCYGCGKTTEIRVMDCWDKFGARWIALDLLDLDRAIPFMPKPSHWIPAKENKILPKQGLPGGAQLI